MFNMKKSLGSLGSLDTKHAWFHILIGIVILMILSVGIRRDIRELLNSGIGRVLMLVVLYLAFMSYGIVAAGLIGVVFVMVVMNDSMREGMENNESKDDTNDDKDDEDDTDDGNDDDEEDANNADDDKDSGSPELNATNGNNKGTTSQLDTERGIQISGMENSKNSEETVKQMNEERKQHEEQDKKKTKEGFVPMGNMIKSMYSMF